MTIEKLYKRDMKPWDLEPHYSRHVGAMTSEALHSKAAIAEQLAVRDQEIARLRAELEALKAPAVWVATSERMPEAKEHVIVYSPLVGQPFEAFQMPNFAFSHRWQFRNGSYCAEDEITHWMPLPTPPQEADDAEG